MMARIRMQSMLLVGLTLLFLVSSSLAVEAAVLQNNASYYINTAHSMAATFKAGTNVSLRPDGSVASGTIAQNNSFYINTARSMAATFLAGTVVTFRPDGSVQ